MPTFIQATLGIATIAAVFGAVILASKGVDDWSALIFLAVLLACLASDTSVICIGDTKQQEQESR